MPGYSAIALVPSQGIFYISGTDYDRAWGGQSRKGREKLFCYDYVSNSTTLTKLWDYQFLGPEWNPINPQYIVKGHDPYQVAGYSLSSPALVDGHVYYGSWNGHVYCFGNAYQTVIEITSFKAIPKLRNIILTWSTEAEIDNAGFNLYRSESENSEYVKINDSLIPAAGSPTQEASYTYVDENVQNTKTYYYKLEDIDTSGNRTMHGPVHAKLKIGFKR
jgi:hypothetical protein